MLTDSHEKPKFEPGLADLSQPAFRPDPMIARERANLRRARGRVKKSVSKRAADWQATPDPVPVEFPRLKSLGVRKKLLRQKEVPMARFPEALPSLADVVCLAVLEANLQRSGAPFTVSGLEWQDVRVEPHWGDVLKAWLHFLAGLAGDDAVDLGSSSNSQSDGIVEVTLSLSHAGVPTMEALKRGPLADTLNNLMALAGNAHLKVTGGEIAVRLYITPSPTASSL